MQINHRRNTENIQKMNSLIYSSNYYFISFTFLFFLFVLPPSVQFSRSVLSDSLWPHGLQHARPPYPSPSPGACSNSCPSSWWCHPTISSSIAPFSSRLQSFPASGSFPMSWFFASGGHSIGASASASDQWILPSYFLLMKDRTPVQETSNSSLSWPCLPFAATWMDLELVILSEGRERRTNTIWYHLNVEQ